MKDNILKYNIYCIITIVLFSTIEVVGKLIGTSISPYGITAWRFLIGGFIMLPFALKEIRDSDTNPKLIDYAGFAVAGIMNVCISMLFLQLSISHGKANLAALVISSNPLFVTIFAALFLKENISKLQVIAIGIGLTGLLLIIFGESEAIRNSANFKMAVIFGLIAAFTFAFSTVFSKKLIIKNGNLTTLCFAFLFGSASLFTFSVITHQTLLFTPSIKNLMLLFYLGIFVSGIAYILYFNAIRMIGAAQASIFFFLKPAFACTLAWLIKNETLKSVQIIGIVLIMLSLSRDYIARLFYKAQLQQEEA